MADSDKTDVTEDSSTSTDAGTDNVEPGTESGDDKDKNFAALRDKNKELEEENVRLRKIAQDNEKGNRSLGKDDEEDDDKAESDRKKKDDANTHLSVVFDRDLREATLQWNQSNDVDAATWNKIKEEVALKGDETLTEIKQKIDKAYHSLPEVRKKREEELRAEGRKQAMQEFNDDELDIGGGGGEGSDTGGGGQTRMTSKEKTFLKAMGVPEKEWGNIDKEVDTTVDKVLEPQKKQ